ncbi:MAG: hypothetical protein EPN38_00990 [Rhodanobacteraceae bacterium]|nr:MAG: hypothetical protein EPN38_00990 [Rhodanobacteraceae bacterium]
MRLLLAICVALLPPRAAAQVRPATQSFAIDPTQSEVQFSVRKFWFAHVRGTFPGLSGSLRRIDTPVGEGLGVVAATLVVDRLVMDAAGDRAHALGPDFFDAAAFPGITFDSDPFPLTLLVPGGRLRGMLALHGERQPVALDLQPSACPRQPLACAIRVRGTIARSRFGIRGWRGVLSSEVELDLRIRLRGAP